jgi:hypothetical protein
MNNTKTKNKNGKADMNYSDIAQIMPSKRHKPVYLIRDSTSKGELH